MLKQIMIQRGNLGSIKAYFLPSLLYGIMGFFTGFVFGAFREIVLIPNFGDAYGHWLEFVPLIAVISAIGFQITKRSKIIGAYGALVTGVFAVSILLLLESALALLFMNVSLSEYLASFNIFEGKLFPYGLLIMALVPWVSQIIIKSS